MRKNTTAAVDAIGQIHIEGNVIPTLWFKNIQRNGKAHFLAINLLADIVYWYRPTIQRDEKSGEVVSISKKFRADKLQKQYDDWADQFGVSHDMVKEAVDFLIERKLITREFRHITTACGTPASNVMYVEPIPLNIADITFAETDHVTEKRGDGVAEKAPDDPTEKEGDHLAENTPPPSRQKVGRRIQILLQILLQIFLQIILVRVR